MDNKYYIVRGQGSGVFFGQVRERNGQEVTLGNVRKLWYWDGAAAVEQIAKDGVKNPSACKFTVSVESMIITDAIQVLPCTNDAAENIMAVKEWKR